MDAFERRRKWLAWMYNIEQRLALYLFETENSKKKPFNVEVIESGSVPNAWEVHLNGKMVHFFTGHDAQLKASKAAGELARDYDLEHVSKDKK